MTDARRLDTNVPGSFYVNTACIDCDTCRQLAPRVFSEVAGYSAVTRQPATPDEERQAFQALLACPTAAIGSEKQDGLQAAIADFPLRRGRRLLLRLHVAQVVRRQQLFHPAPGRQLARRCAALPASACRPI